MNNVRINGELKTDPQLAVKKNIGQVAKMLLIAPPIVHPHVAFSEEYRPIFKVELTGENAEWAADTLYEGAHLEVRAGYIWTQYIPPRSLYRISAYEIDKDRSVTMPADHVPWNFARLSGFFMSQWKSETMPDGTKKVGIAMCCPPDLGRYKGYEPNISVILYGEDAERADGKLKNGQRIDYVEGVMQTWRGQQQKNYGLYVHATKFEF